MHPALRSKLKRFNQARKGKAGRTLLSNFASLTVLQVAGYVFPLITLPYLARVIGVENFGRIAFASSVIVWFQTFVDWGFNYSATREVARHSEDPDTLSRILSTVLQAKLLLMLVAFALLLALSAVIPAFADARLLLVFTFLLVPGHILFPDWFFQGVQRMKYLTVLNLLAKALFTLLVFVVVRQRADYLYQPLLTSAGYLAAGLVALYVIVWRWHIKLRPQPWPTVIRTIRSSTDIFINQIVPNLYCSLGMVLLGSFHGAVANGILDAAWRFYSIVQNIFLNVSRTFFPFFATNLSKHHVYAKYTLLMAGVACLLLIFCAPLLIHLFFTPEFYDAIPILRLLSIASFFQVVQNVYGVNFMLQCGLDHQLRRFTVNASLISFVLSLPLIYFYSYYGFVLTFIIGRALTGGMAYHFVRSHTTF